MANKVYLLYRTDNWHSYASRDLLVVCDSWETLKQRTFQYLKTKLEKKELESVKKDVVFHLENYKQTQNIWTADFEIDVECVTLNEML